jgi:precorrin-6Y C5,15-methyltransferase (decarboxylating)
MNGHPLIVAGIGQDGPAGLSAEARGHIETARVLAGGKRHLGFFPQWRGETILLGGDVPAFVGTLRAKYQHQKTVVLASGDPLFYGIGRALLEAIPRDDLIFLPQVTSVQLAFARVKETWHDACIVSLHGRPLESLVPAVRAREPKIAVLTDPRNNPAAIAGLLCRLDAATEYTLWVCEDLGGADERVSRFSPATNLGDETFSPLNVVILVRDRKTGSSGSGLPLLGIPEAHLLHQSESRGMITRREVRLLALCYLELRAEDVLWDVGAGTGSVSLEAARLSSRLRTYAIERDPTAFARLEANVRQFAPGQVSIRCAEAPEGLTDLPDPDAVFIGGSGGRLAAILTTVSERLKPGSRVVLNCITLENFTHGWEQLRHLGLETEATSVQLAHSRPLGPLHSLEPENPLFILRARKR